MARNREGQFQDVFLKRIQEEEFPGSIVLKNDPNQLQGFPDIIVLIPGGLTVIMEMKKSANEQYQPNQVYYLDYCSAMGYLTFTVFPENAEEVVYEIQQALRTRR